MSAASGPVDTTADLEGVLSKGPGGCFKTLPAGRLWYWDDMSDLEASETVLSVELDEDHYLVHYDPSVYPVAEDRLVDLLQPESLLAPWRAIRIVSMLAEDLAALHELELPQLAVHPGRVATREHRYTLLPTGARMLEPLHELVDSEARSWLEFVAPEAIRTRAATRLRPWLRASDVYSLGALLHVLAGGARAPVVNVDGLKQRVEAVAETLFAVPAGSADLESLLSRMCALVPEHRPALPEVRAELARLESLHQPITTIAALIAANQIDSARRLRGDLATIAENDVFSDASDELRFVDVELALAEDPPNLAAAQQALEGLRPGYVDPIRKHRALARVSSNSDDGLARCCAAYMVAARLSNWDPEIVGEWIETCESFLPDGAEEILAATRSLGYADRPIELIQLRLKCNLLRGAPFDAWIDLALVFPHHPFRQDLFELLAPIAEQIDRRHAMDWQKRNMDRAGLAAPRSEVWRVAGGHQKARELLESARSYVPSKDDSEP